MDPNLRLTNEEETEKNRLFEEGFLDWTRNDYQRFVQSLDMYAPDEYSKISSHVKTKSIDEVKKYSEVFMSRMNELADYERILKNIQNTAKQNEYKKLAPSLIHVKVSSCQNPEEEMKLQKTQKSKYFSPEADIILLILTDKFQYGEW